MKKFALLLLSMPVTAVAETPVLPIPVSKQVFVDGKFDDRIVPAERLERADETEMPVLPLASHASSFDEQIDNAFRLLQRAAPKRAAAPVVASVGKTKESEIKPVATHKKFSNEAAFGTDASVPSETIAAGEATEAVSDGNASLAGLEEQINRAVVARDWDTLQTLLSSYRALPDFNPILHDYALGGLRRSQLRHDEAVALYRGILAQQPDLAYPRFDLGVMMFENKQYREAKAELKRAKPDLQPPMQQLADRYLASIESAQSWQPDVSLQYEQTDNVNNASSEHVIEWNGRRWNKTADSLPQKAHGIRYGAGISREINVGGHHFVYGSLNGDGVHYWDNQDFNEQSLRLAVGYKNRSAVQSFGIVPFAEQNWLGGKRYNRETGINTDFSRHLNEKWRLSLNAGYIKKYYRSSGSAARYNSHMPLAGATLAYSAPKNWLFYGGADWSHDMTKEAEQASVRKGIRFGAVKAFENGFGIRTNLRYARRTFDAPGSLVYRLTRKDHEYQVNASIWHNKISWKGLVPHLNFRYLKIDSNMSGFYSRKSMQTFVSVEKQF
ncbi:surface lipoprotein assembly modifier [Neisseria cinerea]|uniref:surface lipoprotein assembly modifier n=1 Tax=Neisseria cinerea TaxID=483 RepID=UPI000D3AC9ED|nr:surface lipoprotein assembly modifier [Neisseria cinerea]